MVSKAYIQLKAQTQKVGHGDRRGRESMRALQPGLLRLSELLREALRRTFWARERSWV